MTLLDAVSSRIAAKVPELSGKIEGIADFAALVSEGALPQREVAAFVVPLGFDDSGGESAAGAYTQMITDALGVILCIKALGDAKARRALPQLDALINSVRLALAGWAPTPATVGVLRVTRGRLLSVGKGLVVYQLDFALPDQLRIDP